MTDDNDLAPLATEDWDESLAQIINDMGGRPISVHGLMANHPELLKAWWDIRNYTIRGGELGQRNAELVILRVAVHMKNWYEWGSHVQRGLVAGLTRADIERVKDGPDGPGWPPEESLLIRAVDELVQGQSISAVTLEGLGEHFSDRQIMDIVVTHGAYVILGCLLNTWSIELDAEIAARLPDDVNQEQFEREFPRP
ncbi:MAG: carboxymuconolactone decarboxylase family protein [Woeseiaceae bacterium]|nr:carboxymuconolactone decarboxylase family protein [Woeseiaceae bacterium]